MMRIARSLLATTKTSRRIISSAPPGHPRHRRPSTSLQHLHIVREPEENSRYKVPTPINWGISIVPENEVYIIERFGVYRKMLATGIHLLVPILDNIAYVHSLQQKAISMPNLSLVTKDKVTVKIAAVVFVEIVDAKLATYGPKNQFYNVIKVAKSATHEEVSKTTLEMAFQKWGTLDVKITVAINEQLKGCGLKCRYEIRHITRPVEILAALEEAADAERKKQALFSKYEGEAELLLVRVQDTAKAIAKTIDAFKDEGDLDENSFWKLFWSAAGFVVVLLGGGVVFVIYQVKGFGAKKGPKETD